MTGATNQVLTREELITMLQSGKVKEFNNYRSENPKVYIDLERADLSGADLRGAELSFANLTRAYLMNANLSGADLTDVNLEGANLWGARGVPEEVLEKYLKELRDSIEIAD